MDNIDMFMPEQEEIQSMWKEILLNYGIFLLELLTVFGAIALIVLAIVQSKKQSESGSVVLTDFSENYKKQRQSFETFFLSEEETKHQEKKEKKKEKAEAKAEKKRLKGRAGRNLPKRKNPAFLCWILTAICMHTP